MSTAEEWDRLRASAAGRRRESLPNYEPGTPEAVVKVTTWAKSGRSVANMVQYIAERSEHVEEQEKVRDEMGTDHDPADVGKLLEGWKLLADRDNLSRAARAATPAERVAMSDDKRLGKRQAGHLVLSWKPGQHIGRDRAHDIAAEVLRPYTDAGHRTLAVYHNDGGREHVHVVIQARSVTTGKALRIGPAEIQALRERQAAHSKARGIDLQATRREQRPSLRRAIEAGLAPQKTRKRKPRLLLERQVPTWFRRHGEGRTARPADLPPLPRQSEAALRDWAGQRFTPGATDQAATRFKEMLAEAPRTAFWYANHRPDVFGPLREAAEITGAGAARDLAGEVKREARQAGEDLKELAAASVGRQLTQRQIKASDDWRQQAAERLKDAARTPIARQAHNLTLASRAAAKGAMKEAAKIPGVGAVKDLARRVSTTTEAQKIAKRTQQFTKTFGRGKGRDRSPGRGM